MKYVSIIICLVLLVTAIVFIPKDLNSGIIAGSGNGKNEKLEEPEDVLELLACISETESVARAANARSKRGDYESATIHESAYLTMSSSSSYYEEHYDYYGNYYSSYYSSASSTTLSRELSIYMTEDASYYHSIGQITSSSSYDSPENDEDYDNQMYYNFDIEIYLNHDDDEMFIKFNRWDMFGTGEYLIISEEIKGKWVSFDSSLYGAVGFIDEANRSSLSTIGTIISMALSEDLFDENKDQYTLSKKDLKELYGTDNMYKGDFTLNLSDPERPTISFDIDVTNESDNDGNGTSQYYNKTVTNLEYVFENINNTVVEMSKSVDVIEIDEDDFEDYFIIED